MRKTTLAIFAGMLLFPVGSAQAQLSVEFASDGTATPQVAAGFQAAANRWSEVFEDRVALRVTIGFTPLTSGTLSRTQSVLYGVSYAAVRKALETDRRGEDDRQAVASLGAEPARKMLINYTADSPSGFGSAQPYVDSGKEMNNTFVRLTGANMKALGLSTSASQEATIRLNSNVAWDFDPTDGISAGKYDFVGVATRELGRAMGFWSGVDDLDADAALGDYHNAAVYPPSALDLYRYSATSHALGVTDMTAGPGSRYLSLDGGVTILGWMESGVHLGGAGSRQASAWKDGQELGLFAPTLEVGKLGILTERDMQALDVIGWDRRLHPTPAPPALLLFGLGLLGGMRLRRRRG